MELKHPTLSEALQRIVGKPLLSATFIEDYLQLLWEGAFLNAYTMPRVLRDGVEYACESPEYRNAMYGLEGQTLKSVDVRPGERVWLNFSNAALSVSLRDADYVGPEALQFGGGDGPLWVV
jgi:hypothetical protein